MPLSIFKSSAGSGKTYTLAKEYINLALRSPDYYQKILAVTFTNRAAEEMKERVLDFLGKIASGEHELIPFYEKSLGKSREDVTATADVCFRHILHNYGRFSITTIDTFFHGVVRSFSREIGLSGGFGIELDVDKVAEYVSDTIYEGVEDDLQLRRWLVAFSREKLLKGNGYETRSQINKLTEQLFKEGFKRLPKSSFEHKDFKSSLQELKGKLQDEIKQFEDQLFGFASKFEESLQTAGLGVEDLYYKHTGPASFFSKLRKKQFDNLLTQRVEAALNDPVKWTSSTSPNREEIISLAQQVFNPMINEAIGYLELRSAEYYTAKAAQQHLHTLGLMRDLAGRLQEYKKDNEVIMISDLPDFLSQIIDDTGSPFIYEKVGSWFNHFMIDEFQDTSQMQWQNFRPLIQESLAYGHQNIAVGDAKQSIYGWRGGDPNILMEQLESELPAPLAKVDSSKNTNWRSAKNIVEFNNSLFSTLPGILADSLAQEMDSIEVSSILRTYEGADQLVASMHQSVEGLVQVSFLQADSSDWKAHATMTMISQMEELLEQGHQLNDMAILVRTNKEAAEIVSMVLDYRRTQETEIEVISAEGMLLVNSAAVQLLLAAFNHLINPTDQTIRFDLAYRFQTLVKGREFATHDDFATILQGGLPTSFTKHRHHLLHLPLQELIEVIIRTFGLDAVSSEFAYVQAFQDAVLEFGKTNRSDLRLFQTWWQENCLKRSVQLTGALEAVEIITSHKAKGLQYPIVFVPFCNFDLNSRPQTTWYTSPYEETEILPVEYKAGLEKSLFKHSYHTDYVKWHLESLNVLYVAFTRAERGLYAYCEPSKSSRKAHANASNLLLQYFKTQQSSGWNDEQQCFHIGSLEVVESMKEEVVEKLTAYRSYKWSDRLQVRKVGKAYYDEQQDDSRSEGVLLHQILSEIIDKKQTEDVLLKYTEAMLITNDDSKRYQRIFDRLWQNERVCGWFSSDGEIKTEVLVLPQDGEIKRIDRIVIEGHNATVIDFKSGKPRASDKQQVRSYIALLEEMGYSTKGFLLYLHEAEVHEVPTV
ncbi:MAG: UvrD-helicase domain-containing protein [Bacteroidota bacterium]